MTIMDEFLDMPIPYSNEAEQAVLGAVLIDPEAFELLTERLNASEFYSKKHELIFRCMAELHETNEPIDLVTLVSRLQDCGKLEFIGGVSYLSSLANSVPTAANTDYYCSIVHEKYTLRRLIETNKTLMVQAASGEAKQVIASMEAATSHLSELAATKQEFGGIQEIIMDVYDDAEARYIDRELHRGITGVPSGFADLDKLTTGFQRSDLIIVAARPSVGKTAFALNVAQNAGTSTNETIAIFSLEMSKKQLVQRMLSAEANVDSGRMRSGYFEEVDWHNMSLAIGLLSNAKIFIDDSPYLTAIDIRAKCRRLQKKHGLGLVIIDYLQLIAWHGRKENRQQEVTEITRMLKQMARELDVPVIALSQLSRGVEQRQDKRPMMSDLRESGAIEQDADVVAFLYRDDYYNPETEKKNIIEIIVAKQRNGPTGTVELVFMKNYNKFVNMDRSHHKQTNRVNKPIPDMYRSN